MDDRPFYWTAPNCYRPCDCAPSGWYQWTKSGLKYLGASVLEVERAQQWLADQNILDERLTQFTSDDRPKVSEVLAKFAAWLRATAGEKGKDGQ